MFNTGNDLFFTLGPKEFYKTVGYKELAFIYGSTVKPYEVTTKWINRFRYQVQNGTPNRTLQNNAEKEGRELTNHIIEKSKTILKDNGFAENMEFQGDNTVHAIDNLVTISNERIIKLVGEMPNEYNIEEILNNPVPYAGGLELLYAADIRIAAEGSRFGLQEVYCLYFSTLVVFFQQNLYTIQPYLIFK